MLIFCLFWELYGFGSVCCFVGVLVAFFVVVVGFFLIITFSCNDFCLSFKMRERISSFVTTIKHSLKDHSLDVIARFLEFIN